MTSFLLILNFSLVLIAFIFIIYLFLKFNKIQEMEERQRKAMKEMEDLLASYLYEMRDENEQFLKKIKIPTKVVQEVHKNSDQKINSREENQLLTKEAGKPEINIDIKVGDESVEDLLPDYSNVNSDTHLLHNNQEEDTLHTQVLQLSEKGYQIEEIAKLLSKGKTEIELLLKFNQTN